MKDIAIRIINHKNFTVGQKLQNLNSKIYFKFHIITYFNFRTFTIHNSYVRVVMIVVSCLRL